jgi:hypothetical protein
VGRKGEDSEGWRIGVRDVDGDGEFGSGTSVVACLRWVAIVLEMD